MSFIKSPGELDPVAQMRQQQEWEAWIKNKNEAQANDEYILSIRPIGKTEQGTNNFGVFCALLVCGVALCLTGIGAILGIPLIIGGFIKLGSTATTIFEYSLKCPNCENTNVITTRKVKHDVVTKCTSCGKEIILRNDKVVITQETMASIAPNKTESQQSDDDKKCPFCAETIKREAILCRYCGRDLEN